MSGGPARPDVLVLGGGAAGLGAAVAAARAGASVVVVERHGFLGGLATAAHVGTVCGLFARGDGGLGPWAVAGFPRAFAERLARASGTAPTGWRHGLGFLPYTPFAFRALADDVLDEAGVHVALHASVHAVRGEGGRIVAVEAHVAGRPLAWAPGAVVDATGVAVGLTLAGGPVDEDPDYQAAAYVVTLAGLGPIDDAALRLGLHAAMRRAVDAGQLPPDALALSVVPGSVHAGTATLKLGLPGRLRGDADEAALVERRARRLVVAVVAHLRGADAVLADARVVEAAPQVGFRTGRRARGEAVLDEATVLGGHVPDDAVAPGAWPIERWGDAPQPELQLLPVGARYGIPVGALRPAGLTHAWVAGRHLSATPAAVASARVIGTALATGYAAGALAAAEVAGGARDAVVAALRRELFEDA